MRILFSPCRCRHPEAGLKFLPGRLVAPVGFRWGDLITCVVLEYVSMCVCAVIKYE